MSSFTIHAVCLSCAPQVAAISPLVCHIARFLLPLSASVISNVVAGGRESVARFLLATLASEPEIHGLDKRLRARLVMPVAAFAGSVALMEMIRDRFDCRIDAFAVREGVRGGHREAIDWLYSQSDTQRHHNLDGDPRVVDQPYTPEDQLLLFPVDLIAIPAENGDLDMLKSLLDIMRAVLDRSGHSNVFSDTPKLAARAAARHGHNHIIDWLRSRFELPGEYDLANERHTGPFNGRSISQEACRRCREKLHVNHPARKNCTGWRMDYAASCGRLDDVQWFHANRSRHFSSDAINSAIANGHLSIVQWLCANSSDDLEMSTAAMNTAAANGYLEVVRWVYANGEGRCTDDAMEKAAAHGHLDVLKYLTAAGVRASSRALIVGPAQNGHLDVVQWLLLEYNREGMAGIPGLTSFTARAIDAAACRGHFDTVKFLFLNAGSACVPSALAEAAGNNHERIVRWLLQDYHAECLDTVHSVHFSPTTRTRSRQRGSHVVHSIQSAAMNGHLDMVQLLYGFQRGHDDSEGVAGSWDVLHKAFISAAGHGHLKVAKWLFTILADAETTPGVVDREGAIALGTTLADALYLAVGDCCVPVLHWLCNRPELPDALRLRAIDSSSLVIGLNNAAGSADFAMLQWVRQQRLSVNFDTAKMCAADAGMEEVVSWLQQAEGELETCSDV